VNAGDREVDTGLQAQLRGRPGPPHA
jgi:hypothetical protein